MLTVTTNPDLNRNELFRTPVRANDMGMKCLGLPRAELETDFLVSEPRSKTHSWRSVMLGRKNTLAVVPGTTYGLRIPGWEKRDRSGDAPSTGSRVSISSFESVAVTVAVHCSTSNLRVGRYTAT